MPTQTKIIFNLQPIYPIDRFVAEDGNTWPVPHGVVCVRLTHGCGHFLCQSCVASVANHKQLSRFLLFSKCDLRSTVVSSSKNIDVIVAVAATRTRRATSLRQKGLLGGPPIGRRRFIWPPNLTGATNIPIYPKECDHLIRIGNRLTYSVSSLVAAIPFSTNANGKWMPLEWIAGCCKSIEGERERETVGDKLLARVSESIRV